MTKKEMIHQIAVDLHVDQTIVRAVVQRCLDDILDTTIKEGRLELRNFGVFEVKHRAARKARNPKTNQEVFVPAKRVLTFQAGKNVASRVKATGSSK